MKVKKITLTRAKNIKMQEEFINRMESGEYDNCFLKTDEISAINNAFISNSLELSIFISDDQKINENWTVEFNGVSYHHNLLGISYMPYFKIYIQKDHPLLWSYQYDSVECELHGVDNLSTKSRNDLIAELADSYLEQTGGFIRFETNPISNPIRNSNGNRLFLTNQKIFEMVEPILRKQKISIEKIITKSGQQKGWAYRPNVKVILIRNPFVSSIKSIYGQTYIVADKINFKKNSEA